jgi:hypothetical protein
MIKVLFLDCDGVINSEECMTRGLFKTDFPVDPYMAFLVGKIQLDTDCKVVLSSSWRHHEPSVEKLNKQLVPIFDKTPSLPLLGGAEMCERGKEIKAWLDEHPEVKKYAILDDDSDMLPEQLPNFFKTTWKKGITEEIAQKVIKHLS